jgi:hypothetical protein
MEAVTNRNEKRGRPGVAGVATAVAPMLFLLGCQTPLCNAQADAPSYGVSVIEPYDSSTQFRFRSNSGLDLPGTASCAGLDGITSGVVLGLQSTGEIPDGHGICDYVRAELVSGPAQITVLGPASDGPATWMARNGFDFLYSVDQVLIGTCAGILTLELGLGGGAGGIYAAPIPGKDPPVILHRLFQSSDPACGPCGDAFVVQLSKS